MRDPLDSAVQTFVTLDFFNHDTKNTDMATGYEPDIDTIFSFKNNVDSFYLKYLQREHILAELFIVRGIGGAGKHSVKIAEAKLPLSPLLSGEDPQTQVMSWMGTLEKWTGQTLGSILYKFRMRNPLDKAIEMQNRKDAINNKTYNEEEQRMIKQGIKPASDEVAQKKIFEITVKSCHNLKRNDPNVRGPMKPFFSYDFYKFDCKSPTASGSNPIFDVTKHYQVESNRELVDYMKRQTLKIDFIDESVDMEAFKYNEMADYIGSVRFPLHRMLTENKFEGRFDIINMKNELMGQAEIIVKFVDADSAEALALLGTEREDAYKSQIIQKQVKMTIVRTLVEFDLPDLETVLDMLFTVDNMNSNKEITTDTFKQWILRDAKVTVSERDLMLFMKANPALCRKSCLVDKEDLVQMLGDTYRQARYEFLEKKQYADMRYDSLTLEVPDVPSHDISYDRGQRVRNDSYDRNMATTPQFAPDRISRIDGKSEPVRDESRDLSFLQDDSFRVKDKFRALDTLNQRDHDFRA